MRFQRTQIQISSFHFRKLICFSWIVWSALVSPKINHIGFGAHGHARKSRNYRNSKWRREGSQSTQSKTYRSKRSRIIIRSFWAYLFHSLQYKCPKTDNEDRTCCFFCFLRIFYSTSAFVRICNTKKWFEKECNVTPNPRINKPTCSNKGQGQHVFDEHANDVAGILSKNYRHNCRHN